jgi:TolB protein
MVGVQDLAWSADGQRVFFSAMRVKPDYSDYAPTKWAVYSYDLPTRTVTLVAPEAFSVGTAPTSGRIVVGKLVGGNRDLYALDEAGRELARLTTDPTEDFGAAWSPDGRWLAFTSKRGGHSEVFVAAADGSNPRRLIDTGADRTFNPTWSPDGKLIAYYREKGDGADQIHVIRPDGTGDRNLTNDGFNNVFPGWTPDGRVVYGQGQKGGPTNAFVVGVDASGKRPLLGIKSFFVRYSPDGSRIAYLEEHPGAEGVRIVIADREGRVLATVPLGSVGAER